MDIIKDTVETIFLFLFLLLCFPILIFLLLIYLVTGEDRILLTIDKLTVYRDKISHFING